MKKLLAPLAALAITGCGTSQPIPEHKPTLTFACASECQLEYRDPRDRPAMPTNGYDVANTLINTTGGVLTAVAPWAAVGIVATQGIVNAGSQTTTDSTHAPTIVDQPEPRVVNPVIVEQPEPIIFAP